MTGYDQGVIANILVMKDFLERWPVTPWQKGVMSELCSASRMSRTTDGGICSCGPRARRAIRRTRRGRSRRQVFAKTLHLPGVQSVFPSTATSILIVAQNKRQLSFAWDLRCKPAPVVSKSSLPAGPLADSESEL
jgi:hypothetical protein